MTYHRAHVKGHDIIYKAEVHVQNIL